MVTHVKYPNRRYDMLYQIKKLSNFEMQKKEWVVSEYNPKCPCIFSGNMRFPAEMLLDEGDLDKIECAVGKVDWWFYSEEEALKVHKVASSLKKVTNTIGYDKPDLEYLTSPLWQEVVQAAKEAYDYIMTYEDMDDLLRQCREE